MVYHIPALLQESIEGLNIMPDGTYVDVTFGGGGHSMEILNKLKTGRLIAFDQDEDVIMNLPDDKKFLFLNQNFRFLRNNLLFNGVWSPVLNNTHGFLNKSGGGINSLFL